MRFNVPRLLVLLFFGFLFSSCGDGSAFLNGGGSCSGYADPSQSEYVLPFVVGESYLMSQGNCASFTHKGSAKYAYDFSMAIGTTIVASRAGVVVGVEERFSDYNGGTNANYIVILHSDGSIGSYAHLTQSGALASIGETVSQGQAIALSGNTGQSTAPHLHFDVRESQTSSTTIPITFSNALPLVPNALREGISYEASSLGG